MCYYIFKTNTIFEDEENDSNHSGLGLVEVIWVAEVVTWTLRCLV